MNALRNGAGGERMNACKCTDRPNFISGAITLAN